MVTLIHWDDFAKGRRRRKDDTAADIMMTASCRNVFCPPPPFSYHSCPCKRTLGSIWWRRWTESFIPRFLLQKNNKNTVAFWSCARRAAETASRGWNKTQHIYVEVENLEESSYIKWEYKSIYLDAPHWIL